MRLLSECIVVLGIVVAVPLAVMASSNEPSKPMETAEPVMESNVGNVAVGETQLPVRAGESVEVMCATQRGLRIDVERQMASVVCDATSIGPHSIRGPAN